MVRIKKHQWHSQSGKSDSRTIEGCIISSCSINSYDSQHHTGYLVYIRFLHGCGKCDKVVYDGAISKEFYTCFKFLFHYTSKEFYHCQTIVMMRWLLFSSFGKVYGFVVRYNMWSMSYHHIFPHVMIHWCCKRPYRAIY